MKNKKKTVTIIAIIGIGLAIIGGIGFYTCYHTWNAATCLLILWCILLSLTLYYIPYIVSPVFPELLFHHG